MSAQKKGKKRSFKMDSRKDNKVLSERHKTNCVKDRHNKMKEYLKEFFHDVRNVDRVDDCLESLASYLINPNRLFAEVDAVEPKCKVSKDILDTNTSQECSSEHTQRNMIGNTPCMTKNRFQTSKIQRSRYLFGDTPIPIKLRLNSFGARHNSAYHPQFPPFTTSQTCKTFVPELAKDYVPPVAEPMSNIHDTMPCTKTSKEAKERYKPLLEKFSKTKLFFSTTASPALKPWQEWKVAVNNNKELDSIRSKYTLDSSDDDDDDDPSASPTLKPWQERKVAVNNSKELDSIRSKYTLDSDDDPLFLDIEPRMPAELPSGMCEGKVTVKFVKELNKMLAQDFQKERKSLEERHRQISMHYEKLAAKRAAKRASILKELRKDKFAAGRDVLPELTPKMDPVFGDIVMSPNTPNQECQESTRAPFLTSPGPMTPSRGQTSHGIGPCQRGSIDLIRAPLLTSPGPMTPSRGQTPHGIGPCQRGPIDLIRAPLLTSPGPMTPSRGKTRHPGPIDLIRDHSFSPRPL